MEIDVQAFFSGPAGIPAVVHKQGSLFSTHYQLYFAARSIKSEMLCPLVILIDTCIWLSLISLPILLPRQHVPERQYY